MPNRSSAPPQLQLTDDMAFQKRNWQAERIGWAAMALFVFAALLGLFATGPLSWAKVTGASGLLSVEYARFERLSAPTSMTVEVGGAATAQGSLTLLLDRTFLRTFHIQRLEPQAAQQIVGGDGVKLLFSVVPNEPAIVQIYLEPERMGRSRPRVALPGHAPVELPVFVYP